MSICIPPFCLPPSVCFATSAMVPIPSPTASPSADTQNGFKSNEVTLSPVYMIRVSTNRAGTDFFPPTSPKLGMLGLLCVNFNRAIGN